MITVEEMVSPYIQILQARGARLLLRAAVCALILFMSCGRGSERGPGSAMREAGPAAVPDLTAVAWQWADSVTASMDLERKVAQLFMPAVYSSSDLWTLRQVAEYGRMGMGGIILLKGDSRGAAALADTLQKISGVPPFVAVDAEWGLAMRLVDAPAFPANRNIGPEADDRIMFDYGRELAAECRRLGINMVLGPVLDVDGGAGFMGKRSFGGDPRRVAELGIAYARGLEAGNVISVAKHFPGHGAVSTDSHKGKGVLARSLHEMDSLDLYPFRRWVEQRLTGVMVGHLAVPSIDSRMLPAAVSPAVINGLLRGELGFEGLVLTDALSMKGAEGSGSDRALVAGADIIVAPDDTEKGIREITDAVRSGAVRESRLDASVSRILFHKYLLSGGRHGEVDPDNLPDDIMSPQADSISRRLVQ